MVAASRISIVGTPTTPNQMQQVSIAFRNIITDQLLSIFPRLQISLRWAPETCQPPGSKRGRSLAKLHAAIPPPPNFIDAPSIDAVRIMSRKAAITEWSDKWHTPERTSHAYTEVLRGPPDERLCQGLRAIGKANPGKKPTRELSQPYSAS